MRFDFIAAEKAHYPVRVLCEVLEVSRAGFYASRKRRPSKRETEDARVAPLVEAAFQKSGKTYGSPRVHKELLGDGEAVSRRKVRKLMKQQGLVARKPKLFVVTTDSDHKNPIAPNILRRKFSATGPGEKLVGDITYLQTAQGWLYLAVLLDLYSRRVVGYAVSASLETDVALNALDMALSTRALKEGAIHHTDRGVQYTSDDYVKRLEQTTMVQSMSRKGNCWDNALPRASSRASSSKSETCSMGRRRHKRCAGECSTTSPSTT